MKGTPSVRELQTKLAEREQELARLRAELASCADADCQAIQEQLRLSEERARDLIRYAPTGIYELDFRTTRFRSVNDAMCEILGYTRDELMSISAFDVLADQSDRLLFAERIRKTLAGEKVDPSVVYRVKKKDGSLIYGLLSARITYSDGQPDGAFVIAHDVTERHRVADELDRQREQLREANSRLEALAERLAADQRFLTNLLESVPVQIAYLDENLIYRLCNQSAAAEIGQPVERILGRHLHQLNPDNPQVWEAVEGVLRTGWPFRSEEFPVAWADRPEKGTQYYTVAYVPDIDETGRVRGVFAEGQRVTAQVEARRALQEAREQLEQRVAERTAELSKANQELLYQGMLLENVNDAIIVWDRDMRITGWNKRAEEQYGWKAEEVVGAYVPSVVRSQMPEDQRASALRDLDEHGRWQGEVMHARRDGTPMLVDATAMGLRDDAGLTYAYLTVNRDVSERKQAEEARQRHIARSEALVRTAQRLNSQLSLDAVLSGVCEEAARTLRVPGGWINLYDVGREALVYAVGFGLPTDFAERYTPPPRRLLDELAGHGGSVIVHLDARELPPFPNSELYAGARIRSVASATMQHQGQLVGVLTVVTFGDVRRFSEDETLFLQGIADQAAIAIANARLHEQVRADQAQLQKLTHRLVELQESERRYVANELYNDEGQRLATLLLELGLLAREASGNSALMHRITGLRQLADGILSDMHGLAVNLRPASLDRLGLLAALRAHAEDLGRKSGIAVQVVVGEPQQVSLPPDTEAMVYRIAQEALNNAIRYSHASRLGIVATQHDGCLIVVVEDDGEGFDVAESGRSGGLGIVGMRERTQMLGGRLAIETSPGQGTAVYIEVPLPKD